MSNNRDNFPEPCELVKNDGELSACIARVQELADKLRAAERAHHEYEERMGFKDADWPTFYAAHILGEPQVSVIAHGFKRETKRADQKLVDAIVEDKDYLIRHLDGEV